MTLQNSWDYQESVTKAKVMYLNWRSVTVDFIQELWTARKELDARGMNRGNQNVANATFSLYCKEIGIDRSTAHRWLERYIPEEKKILTLEEFKQKQIEEKQKAQEEYYQSPSYILHKRQEEIERNNRIEQVKQNMKQEEYAKVEKNIERENLSNIVEEHLANLEKQSEFREKHLSKVDNLNTFYTVIDDYINSLDDTNRKIEAFNGIIKYCRDRANSLHRA